VPWLPLHLPLAPPPLPLQVVDKGKLRRKRLGISDAELLREVDVMRKLRHPNLVALREVIDDGNKQLYMVQVRRSVDNHGEALAAHLSP
jgi:serine/threonine protein kinase